MISPAFSTYVFKALELFLFTFSSRRGDISRAKFLARNENIGRYNVPFKPQISEALIDGSVFERFSEPPSLKPEAHFRLVVLSCEPPTSNWEGPFVSVGSKILSSKHFNLHIKNDLSTKSLAQDQRGCLL